MIGLENLKLQKGEMLPVDSLDDHELHIQHHSIIAGTYVSEHIKLHFQALLAIQRGDYTAPRQLALGGTDSNMFINECAGNSRCNCEKCQEYDRLYGKTKC